MQRIIPNIWCRGTAAEAGMFYADAFRDARSHVTARYPQTGLPAFQERFAGRELVVDVTVGAYVIRLINAGDEFRPGPAISFIVTVDPRRFADEAGARAEIDRLWAVLSPGGDVRMPLAEYPHSPRYGWVEDRYGVNWQLMLADPAGDERPVLMPQLLFTGDRPQAREAMRTYTALFDGAAPGRIVPGSGDTVVFADFTLSGQWFSAMDAGPDHDFTFTPGVSLQVDCADQAEIDRLWDALSAVPDAEQCGWLVDRFGVSWQIVPADMSTLLRRAGAYQRMMAMTKIIIADL